MEAGEVVVAEVPQYDECARQCIAHREEAVVEAVGARLSGSASRNTIVSSVYVAIRASVDSSLPVIAITGISRSRNIRANAHTSAVSPDADRAKTRSRVVTAPESPCNASPEWMKVAGVPVLARVAAISRPTSPDLPRPVTTR